MFRLLCTISFVCISLGCHRGAVTVILARRYILCNNAVTELTRENIKDLAACTTMSLSRCLLRALPDEVRAAVLV
jgi:hypothetical protein